MGNGRCNERDKESNCTPKTRKATDVDGVGCDLVKLEWMDLASVYDSIEKWLCLVIGQSQSLFSCIKIKEAKVNVGITEE